MKRRWPWFVAYAVVASLQVALIAGAYVLHTLSQEKMMVMRYLVAKNLPLERVWFSEQALVVQAVLFAAAAVALLALGAASLRRGARFIGVQALLGAVPAGIGAWLASSVSVADVYALYALLIAAWLVLLVQGAVLVVSARLSRTKALTPRV